MSVNNTEATRALEKRKAHLEAEVQRLEQLKAAMLSDVQMQAAVLVILRKMRKQGRLNGTDRIEILTADVQFQQGNYIPQFLLKDILKETPYEGEQKREAPR